MNRTLFENNTKMCVCGVEWGCPMFYPSVDLVPLEKRRVLMPEIDERGKKAFVYTVSMSSTFMYKTMY